MIPGHIYKHFHVFKKCKNKFDCLMHEMLLTKQLRACLNVQSDSIIIVVIIIVIVIIIISVWVGVTEMKKIADKN